MQGVVQARCFRRAQGLDVERRQEKSSARGAEDRGEEGEESDRRQDVTVQEAGPRIGDSARFQVGDGAQRQGCEDAADGRGKVENHG